MALYRIAQEALNNVVKHAHAHRAEVKLRCSRAPKNVDGFEEGDGMRDTADASEREGTQETARESAYESC